MDPRPSVPVRNRRVWFSPYLLAVALTPALMQQPISCAKTGDTTLSVLELEVSGENQIAIRSPAAELRCDIAAHGLGGPASALDRSICACLVQLDHGKSATIDGGVFPAGGGEVTLDVPEGQSTLSVYVKAPGGAAGSYRSTCRWDLCFRAPSRGFWTPLLRAVACTDSTAAALPPL